MSRLALVCLALVASSVGAAPQQFERGDLRRITTEVKLQQLTRQNVENAISNPKTMKILTNCFLDSRTCTDPIGQSLVGQVRQLGEGKGCEGCTQEEKKARNELIYYFLSQFQQKYPADYRKVITQIPAILAGLRSRR